MMNCKDTLARLQTFLDRELTDPEVDEVQMHLQLCPPCGDFFSFERKLRRLVKTRGCADRAPEALRQMILRRCQQEDEQAGR